MTVDDLANVVEAGKFLDTKVSLVTPVDMRHTLAVLLENKEETQKLWRVLCTLPAAARNIGQTELALGKGRGK